MTAHTEKRNSFFPIKPVNFLRDISGGAIIALISIPISMGYAQIAGLPMEYGLYGSVFPILIFALLTTSRDFVFGVDAAPAALVGSAVVTMGIEPGSAQARTVVPVLTFMIAGWLLLFFLLRAGRVVQYISSPVMGGFVTGICCTIILMQIPKLFGGAPGTGEAPELVMHIIGQAGKFNLLSFALGITTIVLIMLGKAFIPKVPVSVIVMGAGALLSVLCPVKDMGVTLLPEVERGFGGAVSFSADNMSGNITEYIFSSLSIALVILAESLLASRGNAMKDGYRLDSNREILGYSAANFAAALSGCCPVNASVSRTGIVRQFGVSSQWMSVSACISMIVVLFAATPMIGYLPVPVLTAIVVSALMNACEFGEAFHLWKSSKKEFYIFMGAFAAVLLFGTVYGVIIGVVLSFIAVIISAVTPPRSFLGVIKGKDDFYALERNKDARPVKETVIYRFGGNLFFANIDTFQNDIENAVREETRNIIVNAGAVGNIDTVAAERLLLMYRSFRDRGIGFYITEHVGEVNDMLRRYGAGELLKSGAVRMTVKLALRDAGISYPYPLERASSSYRIAGQKRKRSRIRRNPGNITLSSKGLQPELEWVFGRQAQDYMELIADELLRELMSSETGSFDFVEAEKNTFWGRINLFDEEEIIDILEVRLIKMLEEDPRRILRIEKLLESRRERIENRMLKMDPDFLKRLKVRRNRFAQKLMRSDPEEYKKLMELRREYLEGLEKHNPELAVKYKELYPEKS